MYARLRYASRLVGSAAQRSAQESSYAQLAGSMSRRADRRAARWVAGTRTAHRGRARILACTHSHDRVLDQHLALQLALRQVPACSISCRRGDCGIITCSRSTRACRCAGARSMRRCRAAPARFARGARRLRRRRALARDSRDPGGSRPCPHRIAWPCCCTAGKAVPISLYLMSLAQTLLDAGYDVARLNLRDHGESHHLNQEIFHSCRIAEVVGAVRSLQAHAPGSPAAPGGFFARR